MKKILEAKNINKTYPGVTALDNVNFNVYKACWIEGDEKSYDFKEFKRIKQKYLGQDKSGQLVFLADSAFSLQIVQDKFKRYKW